MLYCRDNNYGSKKKSKKRKYEALNEYTSPKLDIKVESDTDHSSDKKRLKKAKLKHNFSMKLENNGTDEESFLNAMVKEEESKLKLLEDCCSIKDEYEKSGDIDLKHKKSKKKKHKKNSNVQSDVEDKVKVKHKKRDKRSESEERQLSQDEPSVLQSDGHASQAEYCSTEDSFCVASNKWKKKKHIKKPCEESKVFNNMEIEDYFSAAETVIETPKKRKTFKNKKISEQIVFEDEIEKEMPRNDSNTSSEIPERSRSTNNRSTSEDKRHTTNGPPPSDSDEGRRSTRSRSMSADDDRQRTAATSRDLRDLQRRLAAYVTSVGGRVPAEAGLAEAGLAEAGLAEAGGLAEVEAWLVTAPRRVAAASVRHVEVGERWRLKAEGRRYEAAPSRAAPPVAVLLARRAAPGPAPGPAPPAPAPAPALALSALRPLAALRFHQKLPKRVASAEMPPDDFRNNFIPLPATKTRHPLFGADYRASIKITESVTEKLDDARKIKKKSKKAKKLDGYETTHLELDEVDHVKVKKNKKKGKRKPSDAWRSPRAMEEALFQQ